MILPIFIEPQPVLRKEAAPISEITPDIRALADDMLDTMRGAQGIGLAAPQVGRSVALIVLGVEGDEDGPGIPYMQLINPRVTWKSPQRNQFEEGCLSLPGIEANVSRPAKVRVKATTLDGQAVQINAEGLLARVLQHEIDHLQGILFTDLVNKKAIKPRPLVDYPKI